MFSANSIDAFAPLSILSESNEEATTHFIRQQALAGFLDGNISALDYLNILETTGVDIDKYMEEIIPVLREGMRKDLFFPV